MPTETSLPETAESVAVRLDVPPFSTIVSLDAVRVTPGNASSSSIEIKIFCVVADVAYVEALTCILTVSLSASSSASCTVVSVVVAVVDPAEIVISVEERV